MARGLEYNLHMARDLLIHAHNPYLPLSAPGWDALAAADYFQRILNEDPLNSEALWGKGFAHMFIRDGRECELYLALAAESENTPDAYLRLVTALTYKDSIDAKTVPYLRKAFALMLADPTCASQQTRDSLRRYVSDLDAPLQRGKSILKLGCWDIPVQ